MFMSKEVFGIIGTTAAGKDTAGDHISDVLSIPSYQTSTQLIQICIETGVEPTRDNLIELGTELSKKHGDGFLVETILETMPDRGVITGIRQLGQIAALQSMTNLTMISIDANPFLRFERAKRRGKLGEAKTLDEFVANEIAENSPPRTQRLFECMDLAEHQLINEGTIEELHARIDEIFQWN